MSSPGLSGAPASSTHFPKMPPSLKPGLVPFPGKTDFAGMNKLRGAGDGESIPDSLDKFHVFTKVLVSEKSLRK